VGDDVEIDILQEEGQKGNIMALLPRKNELVRPNVANIDQALIIFSLAKPAPSLNLLDRFLVMMRQKDLPCIICFNKKDIAESGEVEKLKEAYENCGSRVLFVSAKEKEGIEALWALLKKKTTTVAGPSGVGKSSLVNCLHKSSVMETGEISEKIERGKHTTRHAEPLFSEEGTYLMDTPGFSSLSLFDMEKEELSGYYPEFAPYTEKCRFRGCVHISEPVCGVKEALAEGRISRVRYENYVMLFEELKNRRKTER
ncbi:MAG: ribosome small subunit-dependent GTPase A, partial [Lachnospiraceae bacterium]|nr:ribosome small subunit-dependent GTPase A [Lachnospiraceae bacterium]